MKGIKGKGGDDSSCFYKGNGGAGWTATYERSSGAGVSNTMDDQPDVNMGENTEPDNVSLGDILNIRIDGIISDFCHDFSGMLRLIRTFDGNTINVRISSEGGDTLLGLAIRAALLDNGATVNVTIEVLAASAATFIAAAGDTVTATPTSFIMIHRSSLCLCGFTTDLAQAAEDLLVIDGVVENIYVEQSGLSLSRIQEIMSSEMLMTATTALELGFITAIAPERSQSRAVNVSNMSSAMKDKIIKAGLKSDATPTIRDYEKALRDAGASAKIAKTILSRGASPDKEGLARRDGVSSEDRDGLVGLVKLTNLINKD